MHHARMDGPRIDERTAHELVADTLLDQVALAGQQAFIRAALPRDHHAVRRHLVAARQDDDIVAHQLVKRDLRTHAPAHAASLRTGHDGEPVGRLLGADLLHDSDDGVANDDEDEHRVFHRARQQDEDRERNVHRVEQRANVLVDDRLERTRLDARVDVHLARGDARGHLVSGQPGYFPFI